MVKKKRLALHLAASDMDQAVVKLCREQAQRFRTAAAKVEAELAAT